MEIVFINANVSFRRYVIPCHNKIINARKFLIISICHRGQLGRLVRTLKRAAHAFLRRKLRQVRDPGVGLFEESWACPDNRC